MCSNFFNNHLNISDHGLSGFSDKYGVRTVIVRIYLQGVNNFFCHCFHHKSSFSQICSTRSTTIRQQIPTTTSGHQILTTTNERQIPTIANEHQIPTTFNEHQTPTKTKFQQLQQTILTRMITVTINTKFHWLATVSSQSPTTTRYLLLTATNGWLLHFLTILFTGTTIIAITDHNH